MEVVIIKYTFLYRNIVWFQLIFYNNGLVSAIGSVMEPKMENIMYAFWNFQSNSPHIPSYMHT